MPRIAMTHSLMDYPKIRIASYKDQLTPFSVSMQTNYTYRGKAYNYEIALSRTPCHYGGYRHWFICPHCGKRVGVLYCAGLYVCRQCIGANYATQLMQPLDKLFRKVAKIRHRLQWQQAQMYAPHYLCPIGGRTWPTSTADYRINEKMRLPDLNDLIADLQLAKDIAIRNENANSLVTATLAQAKPSYLD